MKKTEAEKMPVTDAELDAALAQMAEEVPPMPADFHDRWMNAVRAEAEKPAPSEEPAPEQPISIVRWTRILSVAAVFVFLIGGTLLYRNSKKSLTSSVPLAAEKQENAETVDEPAAEPAVEAAAGAVMEEAEEAAAEEPLMMESYMQAAAVDGAAGAPEEAEDRQDLKAAGAVPNTFAAASKTKPAEAAGIDAEEADYAMEAAEFEEEPAMEAAVYEAAEEAAVPAPTEAPTPEPTAAPTSVPTAEPTAVPTDEPEPEQAGFLPAAGAFFTDMGDFLLAALPYLLVLAVPAVAALVIRRRKNKKGN